MFAFLVRLLLQRNPAAATLRFGYSILLLLLLFATLCCFALLLLLLDSNVCNNIPIVSIVLDCELFAL